MSIDGVVLQLLGSIGITFFVWLVIYFGFVKKSTPKQAGIVFVKIMMVTFFLMIIYQLYLIERGGS
jgi:hypothetical protein